jgi:hypothetical protein
VASLSDDLLPGNNDAVPRRKEFCVGSPTEPVELAVTVLIVVIEQFGKRAIPDFTERIAMVPLGFQEGVG